MSLPGKLLAHGDELIRALATLRFGGAVSHVYNPLEYARAPYKRYLERYATTPKRVVFVGMNPGPFGMAQTGIPFGEVSVVRDWLGITATVGRPPHEHPKRPITGFACTRSEVSGARLWGMFRSLCETPERFFSWGFVVNYCPLVFMEESGRNVTPDKLPPRERAALFAPCDRHLAQVIALLQPEWLVGIGKFAEGRAASAVPGARVYSMPHPSPANPNANRNWAEVALAQLKSQEIDLRAM
jgi:single-strand selective monofunctional uracil DNA glycosylase